MNQSCSARVHQALAGREHWLVARSCEELSSALAGSCFWNEASWPADLTHLYLTKSKSNSVNHKGCECVKKRKKRGEGYLEDREG